MIRGYARVSTVDQDLDNQLEALAAAGAGEIFQEKISGAKRNRRALTDLLDSLKPGDTLLVTRLDRLARSTIDLLTILELVAKRGATFKSLADAWADTTTPHGRLMLTVLGGLAEFERELIMARTGEGIRKARAAGVKFGAPPKMTPGEKVEAAAMLAAGETCQSVAEMYAVSHTTIRRLIPRVPNTAPARHTGAPQASDPRTKATVPSA